MQLWLIRIITAALKDDVIGVNAMLATIPKDAPDDWKPDVAFIGDETSDEVVARDQDAPNYPALYVTENDPLAMEGEAQTNTHRDSLTGQGPGFAIELLLANADTIKAVQARGYILRAVVRTLKRLLDNSSNLEGADPEATRRGDIELVNGERITYGKWQRAAGNQKVVGMVHLLCKGRDNAP